MQPRFSPSASKPSAFTLLELLVTLAIVSLILLAVSGIFVRTVRSQRRTDQRLDRALLVDAIFRRVALDLRGAFLPDYNSSTFVGDADRLEFLTTADAVVKVGENGASFGTVGYLLGRNLEEPGLYHLYRSEESEGDADLKYQELTSRLRTIRLRYLKRDLPTPEQPELVKLEHWDSAAEGALPLAVEFSFVMDWRDQETPAIPSLEDKREYTYTKLIPLPAGFTPEKK